MISDLIGTLQIACAVIVTAFMALYAWRSPWNRSPTGRSMMALAADLLILLVVGVTRTIWGQYPYVDYVRLGSYVIMLAVLSTLLVLLRRAQRRK